MPGRRTSALGDAPTVRQSISFTQRQHDAIARMAKKSHVSFGWLVRYACDQFIADCSNRPLTLDVAEDMERKQNSDAE